jgi:hypothetical protein
VGGKKLRPSCFLERSVCLPFFVLCVRREPSPRYSRPRGENFSTQSVDGSRFGAGGAAFRA